MDPNERPSSVSSGRPGSKVYPKTPIGEKIRQHRNWKRCGMGAVGRFSQDGCIREYNPWRHRMGPWREIIHSFGGNVLIYGRSMMKPLMMKVFAEVLDNELDWEQKSISCSSHNGDTEHVAAAQSILNESEWGLMQCPLDVPLVQFGRQVRRPRRWFHTCSGEHADCSEGNALTRNPACWLYSTELGLVSVIH